MHLNKIAESEIVKESYICIDKPFRDEKSSIRDESGENRQKLFLALGMIFFSLVGCILETLVFQYGWNTFIVPNFAVPAISFVVAFALGNIVYVLTRQSNSLLYHNVVQGSKKTLLELRSDFIYSRVWNIYLPIFNFTLLYLVSFFK